MSDNETARWITEKGMRQAAQNILDVWGPAMQDERDVEELADIIAAECTAPQRGDSVVGRTGDGPHRPLVCFVCANRVPVAFNFCLKHKDEYERLKAAASPQVTPSPAKEFYERHATNVVNVPRPGHPEDHSGWAGVRRASQARFIAKDVLCMPLWDVFDFAEKYAASREVTSGQAEAPTPALGVPWFVTRRTVKQAFRLSAEPTPVENDMLHEFLGATKWESDRDGGLLIHTLEGVMRADSGDWIIRGVKGEFYPCKPDIFAANYEPFTGAGHSSVATQKETK